MLHRVRPVCAEDFGTLLEILGVSGLSEPWINEIQFEWRYYWTHGAPMGFVAVENGQYTSMLMGVFTRPSFAQHARASLRPYLNRQLVERHESGFRELCPNPDNDLEAFEDNCREGLHLHFAHVVFRNMDPIQMAPSRTRIAQAFLQAYAGAPIDSLTVEAHGCEPLESGLLIGLQVWNSFARFCSASGSEDAPTLLGADRNVALTSGNHWLETMLCPSSAQLGLSPKQRRILFHAKNGLGDREIAVLCYLSPASMKTYWDRIYGVFEDQVQGIFAMGSSKRATVLEYVRLHPEECWCPHHPRL